jgi:hypothetical protein
MAAYLEILRYISLLEPLKLLEGISHSLSNLKGVSEGFQEDAK